MHSRYSNEAKIFGKHLSIKLRKRFHNLSFHGVLLIPSFCLVQLLYDWRYLLYKFIHFAIDIISRRDLVQRILKPLVNVVFSWKPIQSIFNTASQIINDIILSKHTKSIKKWFKIIFNIFFFWKICNPL